MSRNFFYGKSLHLGALYRLVKPWTFFAPLAALAKPVAIKPFALIAAKANVLNVFDLTRRKIVRFQLAIIEAKIAGAPIAAHSTSSFASRSYSLGSTLLAHSPHIVAFLRSSSSANHIFFRSNAA